MKYFLINFIEELKKSLIVDNRYKLILDGVKNTIIISFFATLIGIIIGTILALIIEYSKESGKFKIISNLAKIYVTVLRGIPLLLQLMIMYYVIFKNIKNANLLLVASLAFGLNSGAYVAEIIKAGINSIEKGQAEAGKSLGLSYFKTMKLVILPQAIKNILPAIGNEFIALIKETSVAGYIGIRDLTKASDIISSRTFDYFFPLIIASIIYLVIVLGLTKIIKFIERRLV